MVRKIGSTSTDTPKTPTLRQYAKNHGSTPNHSHAVRIFKAGKYGNWSIITDHNFRVSFGEDSPLVREFTANADEWIHEDCALVVLVENGEKGLWSLGIDDEHKTTWVEYEWGWHLADLEKRKKPTRKNQPQGT